MVTMFRELALKENDAVVVAGDLAELGQVANHFASKAAFKDYRAKKADNTLRRQDADLALFADFLRSTGVEVGDLAADPDAWDGITWGLVAAFQSWMLKEGYAVGSVNVRISTIKTYAKLAFKAGSLDANAYALIRGVEGFSRKEVKRIDERRDTAGVDTRVGSKKSDAVSITDRKARKLKAQPDTPQGRRDALLMCLLLDHGLRVGEAAALTVDDFKLDRGELEFYRSKVDKEQTHKLTGDTIRAALAYFQNDAPETGSVWRGSRKGKDDLTAQGFSIRAMNKRVRVLGERAGIEGLSPHDCRHYAATRLAKTKSIKELMDIFGWNSPAMAVRYIEAATIIDVD